MLLGITPGLRDRAIMQICDGAVHLDTVLSFDVLDLRDAEGLVSPASNMESCLAALCIGHHGQDITLDLWSCRTQE